jgi:formate hydrogenlyase subunit 3/multisubunit Na+/H+ antiporter MnhD subunit
MLDSVPIPFQAILWPLAGGGLLLALHRLLPGWVRRLAALAAALASLGVLWSLKSAIRQPVEILWKPLNFFRMSLALAPDGRSLLIGIALAAAAAAMSLGIRARRPQRSVWHGLILLVLAGCLVVIMAANMLALAVGSALIDLALILLVVWRSGRDEAHGTSLSLVVPGIASTMLIFLAALLMDAELGHGSLLSNVLSDQALVLIGVAGALRVLVFPFHARVLRCPETIAALLLPVGAGGYLLARVQALSPALSAPPWVMIVAVLGLVAGGLLAWSSSTRLAERSGEGASPGRWWTGVLVYQAGYMLAFVLLLPNGTPWPVVSMVLVLAVLAIWWDAYLDLEVPKSGGLAQFVESLGPWWEDLWSRTVERLPIPSWWQASGTGRLVALLLPATALASLAGMPFTLGARGRWPYYAAWLKQGDPSLLLILLADMLLVAGLWAALGYCWRQSSEYRPRPVTLIAMIGLTVSTVLIGLAPGILVTGLGLKTGERVNVSAWGLGLLYLLPWLLGIWLARIRSIRRRHLERVWRVANLSWLVRGASWLGRHLVDAVYLLSRVGEGEAWWGWALIILALGVILFTMQ